MKFTANLNLKEHRFFLLILYVVSIGSFKNPTRVTEHTSTAIDLIFVNNPHRLVSKGAKLRSKWSLSYFCHY